MGVLLVLLACAPDLPGASTAGAPAERAAVPPAPLPTDPAVPAGAHPANPEPPPAPDTRPPPEGWPAPADTPGCPPGMARVATGAGGVCIHRFEAALQGDTVRAAAGLVPTVGLTWIEARDACAAAGLHLCTSAEWEDACDGTPGPGGRPHPTEGDPAEACNVGHVETRQYAAAGRSPGCATPEGVWDLEGNLWEWTDPGRTGPDGRPLTDKRGGAHYTGNLVPCGRASVGAHPPDFTGSIGFRCCAAPRD